MQSHVYSNFQQQKQLQLSIQNVIPSLSQVTTQTHHNNYHISYI